MTEPAQLTRRDPSWPVEEGAAAVSEFTSEIQGALSPFGEDPEFPLPVDRLGYRHPRAEDRPNR